MIPVKFLLRGIRRQRSRGSSVLGPIPTEEGRLITPVVQVPPEPHSDVTHPLPRRGV